MNLTPQIADQVLTACQGGAEEASQALSRALDVTIELTPGEVLEVTLAELPAACAGPGLVVVLNLGSVAAVMMIPEATQLLPAWYSAPDATGVSKLATLAQELGMLLLPEDCMPEDFSALAVDDLAAALARGELAPQASAVTLTLTSAGRAETAFLIWPVANPKAMAAVQTTASVAPVETAVPASTSAATAAADTPLRIHADTLEEALPKLPAYTRSLLKIRVPIVVTLASSKQPLNRIIELAPGSIIPFDKSCEDTLSLEVNNHEVAIGEAVKVGDKFGLRITSMILPPERFLPLKRRDA
jgi:flagellar motor switch protein FliN